MPPQDPQHRLEAADGTLRGAWYINGDGDLVLYHPDSGKEWTFQGDGTLDVETLNAESLVNGVVGQGETVTSLLLGGESGDYLPVGAMWHEAVATANDGSNLQSGPRWQWSLDHWADLPVVDTTAISLHARLKIANSANTAKYELRDRTNGFTTIAALTTQSTSYVDLETSPQDYDPGGQWKNDFKISSDGAVDADVDSGGVTIWVKLA